MFDKEEEPSRLRLLDYQDPDWEKKQQEKLQARYERQESLHNYLSRNQSAINVAQFLNARAAATIDEEEIWQSWGHQSIEHYLSWSLGVSRTEAGQLTLVARSLKRFPKAAEAFAGGKLSLHKMAILCRIADEDSEEDLLYLALVATTPQFDKIARAYRGVVRREEEEAEAEKRHASRYLTHYFDEDGTLVIRGRLSADDGATFVSALEATEAELPKDEDAVDPKAARRADALVAMAISSMSPADRTSASPSRPHLIVHIDESAADDGDGNIQIEGGPSITLADVERMACDCTYVGILERDGQPISATWKGRNISLKTRRALHARDETCVWPGCTNRRFVEAHHIMWVSEGGGDQLENLALLCSFHHRKIHSRRFKMKRLENGRFEFYGPDGRLIPNVPDPPAGVVDIASKFEEEGIEFDPESCNKEQDGGPLELANVIRGLFDSIDFKKRRRQAG